MFSIDICSVKINIVSYLTFHQGLNLMYECEVFTIYEKCLIVLQFFLKKGLRYSLLAHSSNATGTKHLILYGKVKGTNTYREFVILLR